MPLPQGFTVIKNYGCNLQMFIISQGPQPVFSGQSYIGGRGLEPTLRVVFRKTLYCVISKTSLKNSAWTNALAYFISSISDEEKKCSAIATRTHCYKTFYGCNLQMFEISQSNCPWQVFQALSNDCQLDYSPPEKTKLKGSWPCHK